MTPETKVEDIFASKVLPPLTYTAASMAEAKLKELAEPDYWDKRYGSPDEKSYDWLRNFESIRLLLEKLLPAAESKPKILHLGCGNSVNGQVLSRLRESLAKFRNRH